MTVRLHHPASSEVEPLLRAWLPPNVRISETAPMALVAYQDERPVALAVFDRLGHYMALQHLAVAPRPGRLRNPLPAIRALWERARLIALSVGQHQIIMPVRCDRRQIAWLRKVLYRLGGSPYVTQAGMEWWALPTGGTG